MNDHDKAHTAYIVFETDLVDNSDKLIGIYSTNAIAETVVKALNKSSSATDSYSYKVVESVLE